MNLFLGSFSFWRVIAFLGALFRVFQRNRTNFVCFCVCGCVCMCTCVCAHSFIIRSWLMSGVYLGRELPRSREMHLRKFLRWEWSGQFKEDEKDIIDGVSG